MNVNQSICLIFYLVPFHYFPSRLNSSQASPIQNLNFITILWLRQVPSQTSFAARISDGKVVKWKINYERSPAHER